MRPSTLQAADVLARSPDAAKVFLTADGNVPEVGAVIKQPELAKRSRPSPIRARKGSMTGRVAAESGRRRARGRRHLDACRISRTYRVVERKPLIGEYHGARIVSASPPSSGGIAVLDALNILAGFDLHRRTIPPRASTWSSKPCAAPTATARFTWAIRTSSKCRWRSSTSKDYAAGQRSSIRTDKAMPSNLLPGIESEPDGMHTTHFSVLDAAGNRVGRHHLGESVLRHGLHAAEDRRAAQQHHG